MIKFGPHMSLFFLTNSSEIALVGVLLDHFPLIFVDDGEIFDKISESPVARHEFPLLRVELEPLHVDICHPQLVEQQPTFFPKKSGQVWNLT